MTESDIKGNCAALRELAQQIASDDLQPGEREKIATLIQCGLALLESLLLDMNRIANVLEVRLK